MKALAGAAVWLALAGATLGACGGEEQEKGQAAPPAVPVASEDAVRAARKTIRTGPRIAGSLDARKRADVRAEAGGQVLEVRAELGQEVDKGQVLARIEARAQADALRSARAAVRSARENLTVAKRQAERTRALVAAGALAQRDLETAQSAAVSAEASLGQAVAQEASARTQLRNTTVRAPMEGAISQAPVHTGDVVAPGAPLFTIIDPSTMRLEASVPSENLAALRVGTPVSFSVRGYPRQLFHGTIERIAPAADPTTRQIPILVGIPNESGALVAGLFAEGRLIGARREALVVPAAAIDTSGESPTATRVRDGVVERVSVQVGVEDATTELVEVVSGLAPGDTVLLRNARALPPGTRVAVAEDGADAAGPGRAARRAPTSRDRTREPAPSAGKPGGAAER